ncbi:MAG: filamentous hemagglutinin N-terminal domain-containing protein, partial [Candidatus Tectomicrobia bacterium]|nr:filamentous hemagglutinin N-terminal domain-containing protein [Candidatus Tectomicrobia bacterium]
MPRKPSRSQWVHLVRRIVVQSSLAGLLLWTVSTAQVQTDITPDNTMGTEVTQIGTTHDITGGMRPGNGQNLFHSFDRFSVGTGDTARFASDPGANNIISRVTGGAESMIDGTLKAEANLFLLNPQGILFGPNATLNVNGSFHASTADELRFADGATFSARLSEKTTLTVAAPSAFGFLSENPAGITLVDSQLEVPDGESLSIVGGDIRIVGDGDPSLGAARISAPGGRVSLVSVASSGNVAFDPTSQQPGLDVESFDQLGDIVIAEGAFVDVSVEDSAEGSAEGSGTVFIRGGQLRIDQSRIFAITRNIDGAEIGVDIEVENEFVLSNGGLVRTDTLGLGNGATVTIRATEVALEGADIISNARGTAEGAGDASAILIEAEYVRLSGGAQLNSITSGAGNGGTVTVRAAQVTLEGATPDNRFVSGIFASALGNAAGAGDAGAILVEAERVRLSGGAQIGSASFFGAGNGGMVTVRASEVALEGATPDNRFFSGILASGEEGGAGDAGAILIEAERVRLSGGAQIGSATRGLGKGGIVTVRATQVTLEGGGILVNAEGDAAGAGGGGAILVEAEHVHLSGGAQIGSATFGPGNGGTVTVRATQVTLEGATPDGRFVSGIFANAEGNAAGAGDAGAGDAGAILVEAEHVHLSGGAQISSSTRGAGNGGIVMVRAMQVTLEGTTPDNSFSSGILASSVGTGDAGSILVAAQDVTLFDGASISAESTQAGGGNIEIEAQTVSMVDSEITTKVLGGEGSGGNILIGGMITPNGDIIAGTGRLNLEGSRIAASTDAGDGGNIAIGARQVVLDRGSEIAANTNAGVGGNVTMTGTVAADGQVLSRAGAVVLRDSR